MAHIILKFKTTMAMNQAICDGLVKRVWAIWLQKDPRRSLKCQVLTANHLAARCMQETGVAHAGVNTQDSRLHQGRPQLGF